MNMLRTHLRRGIRRKYVIDASKAYKAHQINEEVFKLIIVNALGEEMIESLTAKIDKKERRHKKRKELDPLEILP